MKKGFILISFLALGLIFIALGARADWSIAERLTSTSGDASNPAIAIDSNDFIHVVWTDDTPGNDEIYYKRSINAGASWGPDRRLSWTSGYSWNPAIAIDSSDTIHVLWFDSTPGSPEIYYKRSTDGGTTWGSVKRLSWTSSLSRAPAIAVGSGGAIHVVWDDETPGNREIYYKKSLDGGATWGAAKRLTWTSGDSRGPVIAAGSGGAVNVVWDDETPGNSEIYHKRSTDEGETWNAAERLTWTADSSLGLTIALDSSEGIHIAWYDHTPGEYEIYYKRSTDGGTAWSTMRRLSWTADASEEPDIAIDSGDIIYVAWDDDTPGVSEIYFKKSADGGATWTFAQRMTWTPRWSGYPALAADSTDTIHVVWIDETSDYNYQVYYKYGQ